GGSQHQAALPRRADSRPRVAMTPWRRFVRFNLVGALGIGVQLTGLWVLVEVGRAPYLVATAAAVSAAIVHNFLWHVWWTWRGPPARRPALPRRVRPVV